MRSVCAKVLAEEDLPTAFEVFAGNCFAAIDHGLCGNTLAILQRYSFAIKPHDTRSGPDRLLRQQSAQRGIEIAAVERAVVAFQLSLMGGKAHFVTARPMRFREWFEQGGGRRIEVMAA